MRGARCGDGEVTAPEVCDDFNALDGDGCSRDRLSDETCGNGVRDSGEECDDGNQPGRRCLPARLAPRPAAATA
ncbi:MAG: hypothetical protein R2939_19810 [Kofleriaceae bacterium]